LFLIYTDESKDKKRKAINQINREKSNKKSIVNEIASSSKSSLFAKKPGIFSI